MAMAGVSIEMTREAREIIILQHFYYFDRMNKKWGEVVYCGFFTSS
jgi:hypothetical protein